MLQTMLIKTAAIQVKHLIFTFERGDIECHPIFLAGTEILESIRSLSRDILLELFRDDRISEDAGTDQQHRPPVMSPSGVLYVSIEDPRGKLLSLFMIL